MSRLIRLPDAADHYHVFGIPRRLDLDEHELSRRYYELTREQHPDRHAAGSTADQEASTHNTAAVTRAYRTLRDPVARARYWLELHGEKLGDDNKVPAELAALVFEVQERLEEVRSGGDAGAVREDLDDLRARDAALQEQMAANFKAWAEQDEKPGNGKPVSGEPVTNAALLSTLKSILTRRAYLATLMRDAEAALEGRDGSRLRH